MAHTRSPARAPDWDALYATAETQAEHFTLTQAQTMQAELESVEFDCGFHPGNPGNSGHATNRASP